MFLVLQRFLLSCIRFLFLLSFGTNDAGLGDLRVLHVFSLKPTWHADVVLTWLQAPLRQEAVRGGRSAVVCDAGLVSKNDDQGNQVAERRSR